jgi:hypothetical protein
MATMDCFVTFAPRNDAAMVRSLPLVTELQRHRIKDAPRPKRIEDRRHRRKLVTIKNRTWRGAEMRRGTLVNPFDRMLEAPRVAGERPATGAARSTPVCSNCSSDDIVCRSTAQWSNEAQEWQLTETFGQPLHCNECNAPCGIVWLAMN